MRKPSLWPVIAVTICYLLLLTEGQRASAAPVKEAKLRRAVETWIHQATADKRPDASVERLEPYQVNGVTVAYIVHLAGSGYCLAGADSLTLPVYWYCPNGSYDPKNPGCQSILREISKRTGYLRNEIAKGGASLAPHKNALTKREAMWEDLSAGVAASSQTLISARDLGGPSMLELPLTSIWNQTSPYNIRCPAAPAGSPNHTLVGCVATAMAQIMYYWRWPNSGEGTASISYEYRSTAGAVGIPFPFDPQIPVGWQGGILGWDGAGLWMSGGWDETMLESARTITNSINNDLYQSALSDLYDRLTPSESYQIADFGSTTYHWDLLKDAHSDPVDAGDLEVAKLSSHAGIAVDMDYGLLGSAAYGSSPFFVDVSEALVDHFRYDPDVDSGGCDVNEIVEEIGWLRPVFLTGRNEDDEGHCWVVYGYNKSPSQFKMNMGWGGGSDGWYSVDDDNLGFTNSQDQVTMVAPYDAVRFVGAGSSGDGSPSSPYQNIEEAVARASDNTTLIFHANSVNTFTAPVLFINRRLTLKGIQATITK